MMTVMSTILTLVNQKGGTGKTTSTVNLGVYLAAHGKRVLLVDIDPQANATSTLVKPGSVNASIYHTLVGGILPEDIVSATGLFSLDILPASPDLAGATVELVKDKNREFRLYDVLSRIRHTYDYILVDCPPSLGILTLNGIVAADYVLIPVQCEYYAMEGLGQLLNTLGMVRDNLRKEIDVLGAVCTMYDKRNRLSRTVLKEVRRNFPGYVFDAVIPRNVALAEAPGHGKSVYHFDAESSGANAYEQLAQELMQRVSAFQ